jgi:hypothetical protein
MEVTEISNTLEVGIEDFNSWLEKATTDVLRPLNEQAEKLIAKIKEKLDDFLLSCEKLELEGVKQIEKGKAVRKAKLTQKLTRYFLKQLDNLTLPSQTSFSELDNLRHNLEKTISSIERERAIWFSRISPLFIIARKKLDFALTRLIGSVSELNTFLSTDYSKMKAFESILSGIEELKRLSGELEKRESQRIKVQDEIVLLKKNIEDYKQDMESIKVSSELSSLSDVNLRIQQLSKSSKNTFRHLRKPFIKFANMTRDHDYSLSSEELETLHQYSETPFQALASEAVGLPILKRILIKVKQALEEGKLKMKGSRMRKAKHKIGEILNNNVLDELHNDCVQVFSQHKKLVSSRETVMAQKESKQLQRNVTVYKRRMKTLEVRLQSIEQQHQELLEDIRQKRVNLEKLAHDNFEITVKIKLS